MSAGLRASVATPAQAPPAVGPVQLLVVDDDDLDRERVLRMLGRSSLHFEAMQAANGHEALRLVRAHAFDCVMLDHQLGDTSGAELLPAIRQSAQRACAVILITGAGSESLAVQALQDGAADYLSKLTLDADALVRAIRRALEHQRMQQELVTLHQELEERVEQQAEAIRQSERDLRAILDHTPTVIGYWDHALRNRFGNQAWRHWSGVDPERLPGRHLGDVIGASALRRIAWRVAAVLRGRSQAFEQSEPVRHGIGQRHGQYSLRPDIGEDGAVRGFYSSIVDVSAIRQAQARAEELAAFADALFAHSPVGLCVVDALLRCVRANLALARLLGTTPEAMSGRALAQLLQAEGEAAPALASLLDSGRATLADGEPRRLEADLRAASGRPLQASCAWARVDREGLPHGLLVVQDIAEQRRAHASLVSARDAAERATQAKSQFLANMSHEVRTPMNAILGLTQLALAWPLPDEARGFIDKAQQSAHALMALLDDVLDQAKAESGQLRVELLPLELHPLVQRSADLFAGRIAQKGLGWQLELAEDLPDWVLGDPLRLSQVLNNLLGNAVKFTEAGAITLRVRREPGPPARLHFEVQDSGIGIDATHHAALFDAFTQADSSITRRFGGTGLGLAICRSLVALMQGRIGVDSAPGRGSRFWFWVPLRPAARRPGHAAAAAAPAPAPVSGPAPARHVPPAPADADRPLQGLRLLLVEDNELNRLVSRAWLERLGAELVEAADGAEALERLQQAAAAPVDAVLMDVHMPVMDGLEATRRLRAMPALAHLPVIGMTAATRAEDRLACLAAGMDDHLAKPIEIAELVDCLLCWTGRLSRG